VVNDTKKEESNSRKKSKQKLQQSLFALKRILNQHARSIMPLQRIYYIA